MSPKTIASLGHACWHAVTTRSRGNFSAAPPGNHPSTTGFRISVGRPAASFSAHSRFELMRASLILCTQYEHFSMTPLLLTVTFGFFCKFRGVASCELYWKKLNRRTLYGQLFEQYRVPTQRLYVISLSPSSEWLVASTGQTTSHGAFSQCWHIIG
jgi:hypothetical protein